MPFYYPILIGLQALTQSVRPSNTLHLLHNNSQTHLIMYEQEDAAQNTEFSSPGSLGILSFIYVCVYSCACLLVYVCTFDPDSLHAGDITGECVQFPVKQGDRLHPDRLLLIHWARGDDGEAAFENT